MKRARNKAKLPCRCGSLLPAAKCCEQRPGQTLRQGKRDMKKSIPKGFPITPAQLRHADPLALARLLRFLDLEDPAVGTYERLAEMLNEGVTVWKRAHIAVNRKPVAGSPP